VGRLTHFNRYPGFKSSNPVVSDGGRYTSFQTARAGGATGAGRGIFLYDFTKPGKRIARGWSFSPSSATGTC
jgi:hypothetical protein